MSKQKITNIVKRVLATDGLVETGIKGVRLFRVSTPVRCAPTVYEPCVVAILSGTKEAILSGERHVYDNRHYMCCPISMPVEAGTPNASPDNPLLGVYIKLDTRLMTQLAIEIGNADDVSDHFTRRLKTGPQHQSLTLAPWDDRFTDALLRLLQLGDNAVDTAVLGESRLRELSYAVLKGHAGASAQCAFGVGNEIARAIAYLSERVEESVTIEGLAAQVGMSRAVFHRKFKQATTMSPIQFVKSIRLNNAAMKIAEGMPVNEAALNVGYNSSSQFSREFKRMYGQSPKQWSGTAPLPAALT